MSTRLVVDVGFIKSGVKSSIGYEKSYQCKKGLIPANY